MNIEINNKIYNVVIIYKNNKNMYLRVKDDLNIYITAPKYIKEKDIIKFIEINLDGIKKILSAKENKFERNENKFLYLGQSYDICYTNKKDLVLGENKAFIGKAFNLSNWYKKKATEFFKTRFDTCFNNFDETKLKPDLRIRKMKSKWGVCNTTRKIITLNQELIKLDQKYLDYVIYHELCHLVYPNHSQKFWILVSKYVKDYKSYRNQMRNII